MLDADGAFNTVTATDGHPFWVPEAGMWVDAKNLEAGQWLQTSAGTWIQIAALQRHATSTTVYNLTVDGLHTYYVVAGQTEVLVHNTSIGCGPGGSTNPGRWSPGDLDFGPDGRRKKPGAASNRTGEASARSEEGAAEGQARNDRTGSAPAEVSVVGQGVSNAASHTGGGPK